MQDSGGNFKNVAPLRELCIQKARTGLSTESLLSLPNEVLQDLCGASSATDKGCIILITDSPLQSDGNTVSGAICGFHVLNKKFLFGEYEAGVFEEPLENAIWNISVHVKGIVTFIQDFFREGSLLDIWNETNCFLTLKDLTLEDREKRLRAILYQQVARWVLKNNCYFACNLTDEFIKLTKKETIKLRMEVM